MWSRRRWSDWAESASLETARLLIRRYRPSDREIAIAHETDRRIMRWILDPLPQKEVEERVEGLWDDWSADDGAWLCLAVERRRDSEVLGMVALRVTELDLETIEIGFRFHPDHQRRGYCTESVTTLLGWLFDVAGVHKVVGLCAAENEASAGLMESLGFVREGCLREHSRLDGEWRDELVYGMLAGDR